MTDRVVYWTNIPAPYMVDRFNAVARRGQIAIEVWFSAETEEGRHWNVDPSTWEFPHRYLPCLSIGQRRLAVPLPLLLERRPDLLVTLHGGASNIVGWAIARLRGARTAFWVLPTFDAWVTRRDWKERVKRALLPRADAILTSGEDGRNFARRYGVRESRIFCMDHFVNYDYFAGNVEAHRLQRAALRDELGVSGTTFIYVGRLRTEKGVRILLDAFAAVSRRDEDVSLLLVGAGPEEGWLRQRSSAYGLDRVVLTGDRQRPELPALYAAADVFVFPTLGDAFGHVVEEAMSCSLPVISTSAVGEITDRLTDGVEGHIVPPDDAEALADRMLLLARDPSLRRRMGLAAHARAAGRTPDAWAGAFECIVDQLLAASRK